jgi:hypothetical protein
MEIEQVLDKRNLALIALAGVNYFKKLQDVVDLDAHCQVLGHQLQTPGWTFRVKYPVEAELFDGLELVQGGGEGV